MEMEAFFMHSFSFWEKQWCENDFLTLVYSQVEENHVLHTYTQEAEKCGFLLSLC